MHAPDDTPGSTTHARSSWFRGQIVRPSSAQPGKATIEVQSTNHQEARVTRPAPVAHATDKNGAAVLPSGPRFPPPCLSPTPLKQVFQSASGFRTGSACE